MKHVITTVSTMRVIGIVILVIISFVILLQGGETLQYSTSIKGQTKSSSSNTQVKELQQQ